MTHFFSVVYLGWWPNSKTKYASDYIARLVEFHSERKCYETTLSCGVIGIVHTSSWLSTFFDCLVYKTICCFLQTSLIFQWHSNVRALLFDIHTLKVRKVIKSVIL